MSTTRREARHESIKRVIVNLQEGVFKLVMESGDEFFLPIVDFTKFETASKMSQFNEDDLGEYLILTF